MRKLLFICLITMTGCQALGSGFASGVEQQIRLKWAEEWRPALEAKLADSLTEAKDSILSQTTAQIELQEAKTKSMLESVNIKLEDFDRNKDGKVTGIESAELVAALKSAKKKDGKPLGWYEILMAVVLGYGGTTAGKEWVKSKISSKGQKA